ncbi:phage terminase small subunit [Anaerovorax odorimutans]|uniref:phage terminase small subunit n=1 Tax=Anaerovorax odorimutans TaxID=109327 RepID=UPI00041B90CF|nr:phage terminase small subunit [Anaerovorax odorimutans]
MARQRSPNREKAKKLYLQSNGAMKLIDIAAKLDIKDSQVRKWKSQDKWDAELKGTLPNAKRSVTNRKGGQPGNKNALDGGAPPENKNAEKHGFFSKWLPKETLEIINQMPKDPLDVLWDQIQIAYAAIVRAQQIMYVRDQQDVTKSKIGEGYSDTGSSEKWEVQQAWDKQGNFLKAQARAQSELRSMIKQYDELLHKNWDLATEEQKARIENIKANTAKIKGEDTENNNEDDGFMEALEGKVDEVWQE